VIGLSELMRTEALAPLPTAYRDHVDHIRVAGGYLLDLTTDLLDLSAIEAGQLVLDEETFDPEEIVHVVFALLAQQAQAQTVRLEQAPRAGPPLLLRADRRRMTQVLLNIAANAVKFSHRGSMVSVSVGPLERDGVRIDVLDTGRGMTADETRRAMELFGRIHAADAPKVEGSGIGLTLSRELVEAHGGRLTLDSAPGRGTTATVTLPGRRCDPPPQTGDARQCARAVRP
jgi:signal transduction histidine kinase